MKPITLGAGDVYRHVMAGGGGFGDALERDPEKVRADVLDDKITINHARDAYGVIFDDNAQVDSKATLALRAARRSVGTIRRE
jgi:N-methylhydantoinase B